MNDKPFLTINPDPYNEIPSNQKTPSLHAIVEVTQEGSGLGIFFALGMAFVCVSAVTYFLMQLDNGNRYFPLFMAIFVLLLFISVPAGAIAGLWLVKRWGKQLFSSKSTAVTIDAQGMTIAGLGTSPWVDIMGIQKIPRVYHVFIVHTRRFGRVGLTINWDIAAPVFDFYLSQPQHLDGVMGSFDASTPAFKLYVFSWWRFRIWMASGYLAGAASAVGTVLIGGNHTGLKILLILGMTVPLAASIVWFFPLLRLSYPPPKYVRAFTVRAGRLQSTDGQWDIDLNKADIECHHARGLGYDFQVVSIRSPESKRLDVGLLEEELAPFLDGLASRDKQF